MRLTLQTFLLGFATVLALVSAAYNLYIFYKRDEVWVQMLLQIRRSNLLVFPKHPLVAALAAAFMAVVFLTLLIGQIR